jgi:Domain of unknown function (DUF4160)
MNANDDNCPTRRISSVLFQQRGHEPPHVHVQREGSLAKFWLERVALASAEGFSARELRQIEQFVGENGQRWLEAWHEFFDRRNPSESS